MDVKEFAFFAGAAAVGVIMAGFVMSFGKTMPVIGSVLKQAHAGYDS